MASNNSPRFNSLADPNKWKLLADLDSNTLASIQWFKSLHNRMFYCTQDGRLFAWGKNKWGQLGIGHRDDVGTPTLVLGFEGQQVVDIVGSEYITLALTQHGRVYACGENSLKQLEDIPEKCITRPKHIQSLQNIVSIACGRQHLMALDQHGKMFIWGWNVFGQIGNNRRETQSSPMQLNKFTTKVITQIQCGTFNEMVLADNGDVWAWGCLYNQNHHVPVKLNVSKQRVKQIACTIDVLVTLTQQGQIFIHQGNVTRKPQSIQPQHIHFTSVFVVDYAQLDFDQIGYLLLANSDTRHIYHTTGKGVKNNQLTKSSLSPADIIIQYSTIQVSPFKMTLPHFNLSKEDCENSGAYHSNGNANLTKTIADAFDKQDKSDLVFQLPKDGKKIYGHRMLLRLFSPYMERMLSDTWARESEVKVEEYSYSLYYNYIKYLYTGSLPTLTLPGLIDLYDLANCHFEEKLKDECMRLIYHILDVDNCCTIYEFSVHYSLEEFKDKVSEFAKRNFFQIPPESVQQMSPVNLLSFITSILHK